MKNYIAHLQWPKIKLRHLPALVYIMVVQTYLNFSYPMSLRLGSSLDSIVALLLSFASILIFLHFINYPEPFLQLFEGSPFENSLEPTWYRAGIKMSRLVVFHLAFIFYWYLDFMRVPTLWYLILYIHSIITFILFYLALRTTNRTNVLK